MIDLEKLDALCDAATAGPWIRTAGSVSNRDGSFRMDLDHGSYHDCDLIAASRQAVPELVAEVRELRTALSRMVATGYDLVDGTQEADDA